MARTTDETKLYGDDTESDSTANRTDSEAKWADSETDRTDRERNRAAKVRAFTNGEVPVAVYGLGKMGLPLAATFADVTGNTVGVDVDESVVAATNRGECHVVNEPGLPDLVASTVERGALSATTDGDRAAREGALHVVVVPTLLDGDRRADLSLVREVGHTVGRALDPGDMVVLESTVPPGTCRSTLLPLLETESGLDRSEFGLAFCPERTASGRALRDIRGAYPKVVGGVDLESTAVAELVYDQVTDNEVLPVSDATTAEAVKVFEGLYRDVNIALANQVALAGTQLDIDVREAIETANTQPLCSILDPGPGVGGHCIPVYPYFLINELEGDLPLLSAARAINDRMPAFTVDRVRSALAQRGVSIDGARVAVFGLTYKADVAETRNAPARDVVGGLADAGADVLGVDPLLDDTEADLFAPARVVALDDIGSEAGGDGVTGDDPLDAVVVVTPHRQFLDYDWDRLPANCLVVDCHNALDHGRVDRPLYTLAAGFQ